MMVCGLKLYAGNGRANPSGSLREVQYESFITVFGGQLSYPAILKRNQALNLTLHFDGIEDDINTAGMRTSFDSLRVARFAGQYAWRVIYGQARHAMH